MFAKKSVTSQLLLRKQLATLRMKENDTVAAHVNTFENLVRQLKVAGAKMEESDVLAQFFLTLPEKFDALVTALQSVDEDKLTLNKVKERMYLEETKFQERQKESESTIKAAFVSKSVEKKWDKPKFRGRCFKCNELGHKAHQCLKSDSGSDTKQKEKSKQGEARNVNIGSNAVSFMVYRNSNIYDCSKVRFYLDSGASDHLVKDKWCFESLKKLSEPFVINVAKDNQCISAMFGGEINGTSDRGVNVLMKDVYYIPDLRENLLSVRRLTKSGLEVRFQDNKALILRRNEVVATATQYGDLYEIIIEVKNKGSANVCNVEKVELWHKRLGHIGQTGFK